MLTTLKQKCFSEFRDHMQGKGGRDPSQSRQGHSPETLYTNVGYSQACIRRQENTQIPVNLPKERLGKRVVGSSCCPTLKKPVYFSDETTTPPPHHSIPLGNKCFSLDKYLIHTDPLKRSSWVLKGRKH